MSNPRPRHSKKSCEVVSWIQLWTGTIRRSRLVSAHSPFILYKCACKGYAYEAILPSCILTEVRPYMYELLTTLVGIHAQICSVAEPLLDRTLNKLVEQLAEEGLRCFRQIKRFGMGGMLRVCHSLHCHSYTTLTGFNSEFWGSRLPLRSSSCTRHYPDTSLPPPRKHSQTCTTKSPRLTIDDLGMKTSRPILMA